jgi:hypothetical protein
LKGQVLSRRSRRSDLRVSREPSRRTNKANFWGIRRLVIPLMQNKPNFGQLAVETQGPVAQTKPIGDRETGAAVQTKPISRRTARGQGRPDGQCSGRTHRAKQSQFGAGRRPNKANSEPPAPNPRAIMQNKPNFGRLAGSTGPVVQTKPISAWPAIGPGPARTPDTRERVGEPGNAWRRHYERGAEAGCPWQVVRGPVHSVWLQQVRLRRKEDHEDTGSYSP